MSWTYEITTGRLYDLDGNCVATGYSGGNLGETPVGENNPLDEAIQDVGPIPEGLYTFGEPVLQSELGPFAIPLNPDPYNTMYDRAGFYCHGDSLEHPGCASEGCIILPRSTREQMWNSSDHQLRVVASV